MKNHKKYEELIQGYLDDGLDDKEKKDLKDHLQSCKICQGKLNERKNLLETLRPEKEEIECPDYLIEKILKNTTQKEHEPMVGLIRWQYLAVSAAAVFIVFFAVLFNPEGNKQILPATEIKETIEKESPVETETKKVNTISSDEKKKDADKEEKPLVGATSSPEKTEVPKVPEMELSDIKADFAREDKLEEASSGKGIESQAIPEMEMSKEPPSSAAHFRSKSVAFAASETDSKEEVFSEEYLEETRFVFPEEGSVVGEDFEIVLILDKPAEKIEISLDGEKITYYTKTKDSNVVYIGSDSLPPLEEGFHYLSIMTPEEKAITFYKEG